MGMTFVPESLEVTVHCNIVQGTRGTEARSLLSQRFTIAQNWTKRIAKGPQIKPSDVDGP